MGQNSLQEGKTGRNWDQRSRLILIKPRFCNVSLINKTRAFCCRKSQPLFFKKIQAVSAMYWRDRKMKIGTIRHHILHNVNGFIYKKNSKVLSSFDLRKRLCVRTYVSETVQMARLKHIWSHFKEKLLSKEKKYVAYFRKIEDFCWIISIYPRKMTHYLKELIRFSIFCHDLLCYDTVAFCWWAANLKHWL